MSLPLAPSTSLTAVSAATTPSSPGLNSGTTPKCTEPPFRRSGLNRGSWPTRQRMVGTSMLVPTIRCLVGQLPRFNPDLRKGGSVHLGVVPEFSPGLEGVVAAETAVSEVDGANGRLIYRGGYLIEDLAPVASFEETAYLLWHGTLPDKAEVDALRHQMAAARRLNNGARGAMS